MADPSFDPAWISRQVEEYTTLFPLYEQYARTLGKILTQAAKIYAPLAIVQTRPKAIASFAEKLIRKPKPDPLRQYTDLCGGRIIVHTHDQVRALSAFLEAHFEVDPENTTDVSQRLKPTEFGYRSIHYIVQFRPGVFPTNDIKVKIPSKLIGLKAEIQVRTILEHAWADISHEWVYKKDFQLPDKYTRELAGLAATLEAADRTFSRVQEAMMAYVSSYGAYMDPEEMRQEIVRLEIVLQHDPENLDLLNRLGMIAVSLGDWDKVISILEPHRRSGHPKILKLLGLALTKKNKNRPEGSEFKDGQACLEAACCAAPGDADACSTLAGSWKGVDDAKADQLYARAYELDPTDSYPLGNYLERYICDHRDLSILLLLKPVLTGAIVRRRNQADVGVDLPWAYFDIGKFHLLLGQPLESLRAYAKAVQVSSAPFMIQTSLRSLENLSVVGDRLPGYEAAVKLLRLGLALHPQSTEPPLQLLGETASKRHSTSIPIVFVVGNTDLNSRRLQEMRAKILKGVKAFTVGNGSVDQLTFIQHWIKLVLSGRDITKAKVLGLGGDQTAETALMISLALGAQVGVVEDFGGAAARVAKNSDWKTLDNLFKLPADVLIIREFIQPQLAPLNSDSRETLAQTIHSDYLRMRHEKPQEMDPALASWDDLTDELKESNRLQADHIPIKLEVLGYRIEPVRGKQRQKLNLTPREIETLAEREHARWVIERLRGRWQYGAKKNADKKVSPYLVGWADLPEDIKEYDRQTVRKIPEYLQKAGLEIHRIIRNKLK